jgi:hypothetical protein
MLLLVNPEEVQVVQEDHLHQVHQVVVEVVMKN